MTLLSINQPGLTDRQWIYTPATERVRSVAPRERSERFAGSDFTYEDIAERSLDDFTYEPLPAEDNIENHKTFKILATPVTPERSQYKFIYYWVAQDVPCILHAEMYDQDGHKVREMHASGLRKVRRQAGNQCLWNLHRSWRRAPFSHGVGGHAGNELPFCAHAEFAGSIRCDDCRYAGR